MSDQVLNQILDELKSLNTRMGSLEDRQQNFEDGQQTLLARQATLEDGQQALLARQAALEAKQSSFEAELKEIKANTADIPLIRQAVLETLDITKRLDLSQKSFERKTTNQLNTHEYSIDIINRRQLKLEADLESLKSK
ncbi:hypothetical protein [Paenibacillus lentus]|uniref:Uncharacterized protein n=1 Tax=Paenibacillus lentus TaxID=1338368 RepID=A0A3Q8S4N2_9BACL|nr:hypothetical protein [Paenibacillus lentus]AZK46423.1 hypothetical protein EIM92_09750 [Paenibacillus lentus]